ncbi:unnamed protein product [Onchocerca flexuosa]|uniref:Uncharacterized protein n=1 Tax=Onchocerca flexuosa TaxID=387005 RepID=A0A183I691_9BILA|nr:unnamed protein product [Onchocerca flexuosa]
MILEGCEGTSLPGGPVVKNPPADEAGDRVFSIDPRSGKMPLGSGQVGCGRHTPLGQDVPKTVAGGAGDLRELSVLSAPFCPRNPNLLKERIQPMERQTHIFTQLSGCLFFLRSRPIHWKNTWSRMRSPSARRLQCAHISMATACGHRTESLTPVFQTPVSTMAEQF